MLTSSYMCWPGFTDLLQQCWDFSLCDVLNKSHEKWYVTGYYVLIIALTYFLWKFIVPPQTKLAIKVIANLFLHPKMSGYLLFLAGKLFIYCYGQFKNNLSILTIVCALVYNSLKWWLLEFR